jgi:putative polyhydroxyalkanoate system protein
VAVIQVTEAHSLTPEQAIARIGGFAAFLAKYGVKVAWQGTRADLDGLGVQGSVAVSDCDATVTLKLGMMARAAGVDAQKLEQSIRKRLKAAFA